MTQVIAQRLADLELAVADLTGVQDCVVVSCEDRTVVYLVPAAGADRDHVLAQVGGLVDQVTQGPVETLAIHRVPRLAGGGPDLEALLGLAAAPRKAAEAQEAGAPRPAAVTHGPEPEILPSDPETVTEAILQSPTRFPELGVRAVSWQGDVRGTYPELLADARRVLGGLRRRGLAAGSPAILVFSTLADYFPAVWACVLGGIPFVTVSAPPAFDRTGPVLDKLMNAWRDLGRPPVLCDDALAAELAGVGALYGGTGPDCWPMSPLRRSPECPDAHPARPEDVAVLALSSGSTGKSKVIPVTHRAVVQNALCARQVGLVRPGETSFNWLPFDHVAPVVMYLLRDVVLGCEGIHAPTAYIVEQPLRWLEVMERYGVHHTWSANFAYRMLADALAGSSGSWDLSAVRTVLNAGEQCSPAVIRDFLDAVAPHGIDATAVVHMWGMAETATCSTSSYFARPGSVRRILTSTLGGRIREAGPDVPDADCIEFMSMGPAAPGCAVRIADGNGTVLPEAVIGRFQVRSPRVTPGYLDNPAANAEAFTADGWFDTGDLAFLLDGEVVITGRAKELLVINGEKYLCHEVEEAVGALDEVATGLVAACGVPDPATGSETLAVFYVPAPGAAPSPAAIDRIRATVSARIRLTPTHVLPVVESEFPRTTSGKVQRAALVARMAAGEFDETAEAIETARIRDGVLRPCWTALEPQPAERTVPAGATLLFTDALGLGAALTAAGLAGEVVTVRPGPRFACTGDGYVLNPEAPEDWRRLRAELDAEGVRPTTLGYLWSYLPTVDPVADRDAARDAAARCGAHLVAACRALLDGPGPYRLVTVSRRLRHIAGAGGDGVCYPAAQTPVLTAAMAAENREVTGVHIDLPGDCAEADAKTLLTALADRSVRYGEVAWRDGLPHVREFEPAGTAGPAGPSVIQGGRYLVTGGAGGIGAGLVADLVDRYGADVLVVGRSVPAGPAGDRVIRRQADVCDAAALERAIADAEAAWGAPLDGAFHLADSYRVRPLAEEDFRDWDPSANAKVGGLLNVLACVRERPGARLVVFSSLISALTFAGCSAYAAGNAFAEALVEHESGRLHVQSLSWGLWDGLGLNADNPYEAAVVRRGVLALPPERARTLTRLLLPEPSGVYCIGLNAAVPDVRARLVGAEDLLLRPAADDAGTPDGTAPRTAGESAALEVLCAQLAEFTDRPVSAADRPYDMGLSSVELLRLHARLEGAYGVELPRSALFAQSTVHDLLGLIAARVPVPEG
ncbi:SDR family NAD(P)-dependent oxidoreductase [Streptomyces sp. NPDC020742]|uniref:SDR family NAD(P)-dependent oxidoreductase n=1 Tax=Streptomyces sp. NPDC020742 TaxID=3154897 RepID=UPI0033CB8056